MVEHTQKIPRQKPRSCLRVFYHFVGLALKGLSLYAWKLAISMETRNQHWIKVFTLQVLTEAVVQKCSAEKLRTLGKFRGKCLWWSAILVSCKLKAGNVTIIALHSLLRPFRKFSEQLFYGITADSCICIYQRFCSLILGKKRIHLKKLHLCTYRDKQITHRFSFTGLTGLTSSYYYIGITTLMYKKKRIQQKRKCETLEIYSVLLDNYELVESEVSTLFLVVFNSFQC